MKKRIIDVVRKTIESVATVSSEATSILGLYQPKTPNALIKSNKKK
ncbi:MAG: cyclic lactone autoinducer peptide [Ruminococcus flavefaciens]|nr:cyclic lactone autoinducer peptide [Ruminococcus flavefaciens]MCM1062029.1 cyclic lactone autoinducer peptide [Eubacterium sp.]